MAQVGKSTDAFTPTRSDGTKIHLTPTNSLDRFVCNHCNMVCLTQNHINDHVRRLHRDRKNLPVTLRDFHIVDVYSVQAGASTSGLSSSSPPLKRPAVASPETPSDILIHEQGDSDEDEDDDEDIAPFDISSFVDTSNKAVVEVAVVRDEEPARPPPPKKRARIDDIVNLPLKISAVSEMPVDERPVTVAEMNKMKKDLKLLQIHLSSIVGDMQSTIQQIAQLNARVEAIEGQAFKMLESVYALTMLQNNSSKSVEGFISEMSENFDQLQTELHQKNILMKKTDETKDSKLDPISPSKATTSPASTTKPVLNGSKNASSSSANSTT